MTTLVIEKQSTRAWWKELWVQVLIAMVLGVALGVANPDLGTKMQLFGDAFITTIALVIALVMVNLLKPGAGMNIDPSTINASVVEPYVKQTAAVGLVPFLMNII